MSFVVRCIFTIVPALACFWSRKEMNFPKGGLEWALIATWLLITVHFVFGKVHEGFFCFVLSMLLCLAMECASKIGAKFRRR